MTTDTALIEKREELKRRLTAGEYKTLVDIFLAGTDRLIRKITRRSKPLSIWVIAVILYITFILIGFVAVYIMNDLTTILNLLEPYREAGVLGILIGSFSGFLAFASVFVMNQYVNRIFVFWRENVLDAIQSVESLGDFEDWLEQICNRRLHLLAAIIGGFLVGLYWVTLLSARLGVFIGYATTFTNIILFVFSSASLYLFFLVVLLSARLRRYDLKLFSADPSNSEIVSRLSSELNFVIYFVTFLATMLTLFSVWTKFLPSFGIVLVLLMWLPLIVMFILNQTSLASIVRRAKWKTLNEVQAKIEKLRESKSFGTPKTMDAINKLMDFHDRVKATRNSAIDSNTILNFINSLLLPLLAFLLGNLDKVLKMFTGKP